MSECWAPRPPAGQNDRWVHPLGNRIWPPGPAGTRFRSVAGEFHLPERSNSTHDSFQTAQEASKTTQERPKSAPGPPKMASRQPKSAPRGPSSGPQGAKTAPCPEEARVLFARLFFPLQERPLRPRGAPRSPHDGPRGPQRGPKTGISCEASGEPRGGSFEASFRPPGGLSGASWAFAGALGAPLGAEGSKSQFVFPLLGPSWAVLGASWAVSGPSWAVLGHSWGPLGPSWADLGPSWTLRRPKSRTCKKYIFRKDCRILASQGPHVGGAVGAILGRLGAILGSLGAIIGRLGRILGHLAGRPWWPSWAVLEALGTPREASWPSREPRKRERCMGGDASRGGALRRLQKPCLTALGILARLNVPGGTVADIEEIRR